MEWVPEGLYVDYANTLQTDGYALMNLRAGRALTRGWSLFVSLENAADEAFVNSVAPQSGLNDSISRETSALFPGQERRWQIGLECAF